MHLLIFLCLNFFSSGDPAIDSVAAHLPAPWKLSVSNGILLITYPDSVWTCTASLINANDSYGENYSLVGKDSVPPDVKKSCTHELVYVKYRLDPKWSEEKWKSAERKNDSLNKLVRELPEKIGIQERFLFGMYPSESAPPDLDKKKMAYYKQRGNLEGQLINLPSFETSKYSLVSVAYPGTLSNASYEEKIWPKRVNDEMEQIVNVLLPEYCPSRKK